ncbi:MAG: hypothetical protein M3179_00405 [Actinomycetota bacterium]|nr:hypothetical protein [Actinomycetota bacterium]
MNRARLSFGEMLSCAGGVLLLLATLLPWFQREILTGLSGGSFEAGPGDINAWQAFGIFTVVYLLVAAVPLWQAVRRVRDDMPARPQIHVATGAVAVTLVLGGAALKLGNETLAGPIDRILSTSAAGGLVVAALAALLIAVGGVSAMWGQRPVGHGRTSP